MKHSPVSGSPEITTFGSWRGLFYEINDDKENYFEAFRSKILVTYMLEKLKESTIIGSRLSP